jgi:hypothetical protein
MRTLSTADAAVLATRDYVAHRRVKVANSAGTLIDMTALETYDFVEAVSWGGNVEQTIANATVTFRREVEKLSLAPLMATSKLNILAGVYSPALAEGRLITIEVAVTAPGVTPSTWMEVFRGEIDSIDAGPDVISVEARDLACRLMDRFIEDDSREYGSDVGVLAETVMQSILTDNGTGETLWCPSSPAFVIAPKYRQKQEAVLQALETIALLFGGQLRHVYDSGTSAWRLKLSVPERAAPVSTYTFTADHYLSVERLWSSRQEVRNKIRGRHYLTTLDAGGQRIYSTVLVQDATSITKYGGPSAVPRYMEIRLDKTDVISTDAQMTTLLNAALSDLKDPLAEFGVTMPLFPHVEVNDFYTWSANGVHFTADQGFAVVSYEHSFPARGMATTRMDLRGKPTIGARRWLVLDTRIAKEPANNVGTGPSAPTNLATQPIIGGAMVTWQGPASGGQDVAEYEVHVSDTSGFTPNSDSHKGTTDGTSFPVDNVPVGETRYVKIVPRDAQGNRGTVSAQLSVTAGELPESMGQFDGITIRQIAKGHYAGTAKNESAITFPQSYQNAPVVLVGLGGLVDQTGAVWGTTWDGPNQRYGTSARPAGNIYNEVYAYDVTAATCKIRARLRSKSGSTLRTANADTADNNLTAVGHTAAATIHTAPSGAVGDAYTIKFKVSVQTDDPMNGGDPGPPPTLPYLLTVTAVIAIDSSIDGGTNWVERATYSYAASARDVTAADSWPTEVKTVNVSGLTSGAPADKLRIRIKSFTFNGTSGSVSAHLFSTVATVPDLDPGLSYYTAADAYANKTPDTEDVVTFDIFEVN